MHAGPAPLRMSHSLTMFCQTVCKAIDEKLTTMQRTIITSLQSIKQGNQLQTAPAQATPADTTIGGSSTDGDEPVQQDATEIDAIQRLIARGEMPSQSGKTRSITFRLDRRALRT